METALFKIFGWLINLDTLVTIVLLLSVGLLYSRFRRGGRRMLVILSFLIIMIVVMPFGRWTVALLENRFETRHELTQDTVGIILLGGSFDRPTTLARGVTSYNIAAGRFIAFTELARIYPDKRLLFTGGGRPMPNTVNEASLAKNVWQNLGFDVERVIFESDSRSTVENATLSYELIQPEKHERWALVTSAAHLPRAVGLFRKAGWNIVPYPVDYHTDGRMEWTINFSMCNGFQAWRVAMREFAGLILNYWTGKSEELLPSS